MDKKVKLTYICLLKYGINPSGWHRWKDKKITPEIPIVKVIGASLKTKQYNSSIPEIMDFMEYYEYKWNILKCRTK